MTTVPHDHDDEGNCIRAWNSSSLYPGGLATWRFSPWDVVGIMATTVGGLFTVVGQGLNLLAREFCAMANYSRQEYELRQAQEAYDAHQALAAADLRRLLDDGPLS